MSRKKILTFVVATFFLIANVAVLASPEFHTWKTIKLGTSLKTADDFRRVFTVDGFRIGNLGNDILGKPAFKAATTQIDVNLLNVSVAELGFKDGATRKDIYERAISLGLSLCPNEVGPQLRLQYKDQPNGEWLRIAMKPITASDNNLRIFEVGHDGDGLWLIGGNGRSGGFWAGSSRFVFIRPRK